MGKKNFNLWFNRRLIILVASIGLIVVVALVSSGMFETLVEKDIQQIEQEPYVEEVEIANDDKSDLNSEEMSRETIFSIIEEIFAAWECGDLLYEDAKTSLEHYATCDDKDIVSQCIEYLAYMAVEEEGEHLLEKAQISLRDGDYVGVFQAVVSVSPFFSRFDVVQSLSEECKTEVLQSVSDPKTENDFRSYIKLLDECSELLGNADFVSRRIQLEEELEIYLAVSEIIDTATILYDKSMVSDALLMLTFGLIEYPDNERLNTSVVDFSDHYIITISKQVADLCEVEEYNAALDIVEAALEEYECEEFLLLRESIKERRNVLYKFKNDLVRHFEIMAPGWDKETFDVKQAVSETGSYIVKSGKKLVLGDYLEEDVTILSFGGNIVASLAGVDFLFDLRDVTYDVTHWGEEEYFAFYLAADVIALLPVIGVVKYFQHIKTVGDGAKAAMDVVDSVADVGKAADDAADVVDTMVDVAKTGDNIADTVDAAKDATKLGQAAKDVITKVTKGYDPLSTINNRYLGNSHPETGVEFEKDFLKYSDGQKCVGVFPKFDSSADVQMPKELYKASFPQQEKYCLEQLQKQIKNPFSGTKKNFSDYEVQQILEGILPSGYTWHHNQKEGFMQLVETTIHNATGHTGGMSLWGVGYN